MYARGIWNSIFAAQREIDAQKAAAAATQQQSQQRQKYKQEAKERQYKQERSRSHQPVSIDCIKTREEWI